MCTSHEKGGAEAPPPFFNPASALRRARAVECNDKEESDDTISRSKNLDMWNKYLNYLIKWAVTHANDEDYIGDYPLSYYDDWDKE